LMWLPGADQQIALVESPLADARAVRVS
jgi:hypothetical protein